jgi:hypothetical protein
MCSRSTVQSQILADHSEKVLDPALGGADPGARAIQASGDIAPAALKSAEGTHNRHVVGTRRRPVRTCTTPPAIREKPSRAAVHRPVSIKAAVDKRESSRGA